MHYTVVFFTHSGAIKFERRMSKLNVSCSLHPVPRKISSSCGICAKICFDENINDLIEDEIQSLYKDISKNQYELIYTHENE